MNSRRLKDRQGRFRTELFERYRRSEKALAMAMMEMYLQGVSTCKNSRFTLHARPVYKLCLPRKSKRN
jgi:transposase-like protein